MVFASSRDLDHTHTDKQNGVSTELYPQVVLYLLVFYLPPTRLTVAVKSLFFLRPPYCLTMQAQGSGSRDGPLQPQKRNNRSAIWSSPGFITSSPLLTLRRSLIIFWEHVFALWTRDTTLKGFRSFGGILRKREEVRTRGPTEVERLIPNSI